MKQKYIIFFLIYLPLYVVLSFSTKSFAESVLIFKEGMMNAAYIPHTIVLPDCKSVPYMAVRATCLQTDGNLTVYSLQFGTCSGYSKSIMINFLGVEESITALLEQAPFVHYDIGTGLATPIDLASAAVCANLNPGGGGGGPTDRCPNDPNKTQPGLCGCGVADTDSDDDGTPDCNDNCPNNYNPGQEDSNSNNIGDVCECELDSEPDGDVDGVDLVHELIGGGSNIIKFAEDFGRTGCPGIY